MNCLIATLGFDIDFVVRRLSRGGVSRVVCIGVRVDDTSWVRVEKAFNMIKIYCSSARVDCVLEPVKLDNAVVGEIRSILEREVRRGCSQLELYLTGGPRIAVVSTIIASLLLPRDLANKVTINVEGEGFEASLRIPLEPLIRILELSEVDRRIVVEASKEPLTPTELSRKTSIPKATAYRRMRLLASIGLLSKVSEVEERYTTTDSIVRLIKLARMV